MQQNHVTSQWTVVTSIPTVYTYKSFFETTELFCKSLRRVDQHVPVLLFVPADYDIDLKLVSELNVNVIKIDLPYTELLMSNVLKIIPNYVKTEYFMYFTTENLILQNIDYSRYANNNIYVTLTPMDLQSSYFNFERLIHKCYTNVDNNNSDMILEYMIAGRTDSTLWSEFNELSIKILDWLTQNYSMISDYYPDNLKQYILPAADLVSLNILMQQQQYSFKNFPHSFVSLHSGLTEKFVPASADSLFYQYSGLYHNRANWLNTLPDAQFKQWLGKELIKYDVARFGKLAVQLCK